MEDTVDEAGVEPPQPTHNTLLMTARASSLQERKKKPATSAFGDGSDDELGGKLAVGLNEPFESVLQQTLI